MGDSTTVEFNYNHGRRRPYLIWPLAKFVAGWRLGDFSCLGTHGLSSSEKFSQHHFANVSAGLVQDYMVI